jgi:zinc transporter 1/2/3
MRIRNFFPCKGCYLYALVLALAINPAQAAVNGRPSSNGVCDLAAAGAQEQLTSNLRIAAIFIVLISSTLGIVLPFLPQLATNKLSKSSKARRFWDETFFVLKYAGAGVIIATAFVHLTYEAFVQLESPCITLAYAPLAPVLSMSSLSVIFLVDCFLTRYLHRLRKKTASNRKLIKEQQLHSQMLNPDQAVSGSTHISTLKSMDSLEREDEQERLLEERLDEQSRELEVMVIEGGIV